MPIEPPATGAHGQRAVADLDADAARAATSSASAAIWVSTVRAPVPMSAAPIRTVKRAVGARARAVAGDGARRSRVGRRGDAGADQPAARRAARRASGRGRVPAEALGALAQARDEVARLNGRPRLGVDVAARCGSRSSIGSMPQRDARARPSRDSSANMPGASPGARIHDGVGTSSAREPVRRCGGSAPRTSSASATAVCSANSLSVERLLDDVVVDRGEPPVGVGAEPDALDRRRAVAGEREHLLAGRRASFTGRPTCLAAIAASDHVRARRALGAEAAADVRRR